MSKPVVLVTGASKGIGLAVTRSLLEEHNAAVVAVSRSETDQLVSLSKQHPQALSIISCDVSNEAAFRHAIEQAHGIHQRIDGLVLNAGALEPLGRIGDLDNTLDSWRAHFEVNFFSLVTALQAALPHLRKSEQGGKIIFISSGAATGSTAGWGPYNASKAALNSLSRTLAQEEPGIVSLALAPGKVDTDMQLHLRQQGAPHMTEKDHKVFLDAHKDGVLVNSFDVGYVIAGLALRAPSSLSGKAVRWDDADCQGFRREHVQPEAGGSV
ncbi:short-chain dehydrogenase [Coniophora puteana RWD-64-598 SS2]|uniref:Short-chain dehydrogenase n=1 Tax=Coniophora puteana (strain RWD-64-598) TaxID=741705 RepID=A0A5M3MSJ7_CONPW|nr:short-chain dehydrogenase [Coniophora puteana RWD-64-598 SS2]EIW82138.1 short-chain dehydrogenase [Coniophora puteana RWD-64-598 SS2]